MNVGFRPGRVWFRAWYERTPYADEELRQLDGPRYTSKAEPSTADMIAKLRRVIIAAKFCGGNHCGR